MNDVRQAGPMNDDRSVCPQGRALGTASGATLQCGASAFGLPVARATAFGLPVAGCGQSARFRKNILQFGLPVAQSVHISLDIDGFLMLECSCDEGRVEKSWQPTTDS